MPTQQPHGRPPVPHQTEPTANAALGSLLQHRLPGSQVRSENTQVIAGHAGQQPDVLITTPRPCARRRGSGIPPGLQRGKRCRNTPQLVHHR